MESERSNGASCSVFAASAILLAVYFYYELFVQSDLRFPRDRAEAGDMYDFLPASTSEEETPRFSLGWWALQTHHLFGIGVALLGVSYVGATDLRIGGALSFCCCGYFALVALALLGALWWWFLLCNSIGDECLILRERAHDTDLENNIRYQIPIFYALMLVASACFLVPFTFYFFRRASRRAEQVERKERRTRRQSSNSSEAALLRREKRPVLTETLFSARLQKKEVKTL